MPKKETITVRGIEFELDFDYEGYIATGDVEGNVVTTFGKLTMGKEIGSYCRETIKESIEEILDEIDE